MSTADSSTTDILSGATIVLDPVKGLIPITEQKEKYGAMVNPLNEEYRQYMNDVLTDLIARYSELDGVMLDRVRYDGISADFSGPLPPEIRRIYG